MIAGNIPCNARNVYYGKIQSSLRECDLLDFVWVLKGRYDDVNIQYTGKDVSIDMFVEILTSSFDLVYIKNRRITPLCFFKVSIKLEFSKPCVTLHQWTWRR